MEKLTGKEKCCLLEYLNELKTLIKEDNLLTISDNLYSYTWGEVDLLSAKIKKFNEL